MGSFQAGIRGEFASFISDNYADWLANPDAYRPPLSVDVVSEFLIPTLQRYGKVLFVVVDCLRLDQWEMLKPSIANLFDVEVSHHYSILPTATPFSRNAIFAGLFPGEIAEKYPQWWHFQDDGRSLNSYEQQLLDRQLTELTGEEIPSRYEKMSSLAGGHDMLKRLSGHLSQPGVTSLVFNFVDQLTHGRSEHEILYQVASDAAALRSLTRTWFEDSALMAALKEAERREVPVILTTDHGSIHCHSPATVFAKKDASKHLRYKFGEDVRTENPQHGIVVDDLPAWGLPPGGLGVRLTMATGDRFFVYPTKLREYRSRYKGSFLHGGVTPEEMIVPVALLTPRVGV
ncbi:MAG: PglZ domain-containing protein [Chloroflexi bacterium]|nr:PglZ domain-containing protein [Chloroflexota bacterium]